MVLIDFKEDALNAIDELPQPVQLDILDRVEEMKKDPDTVLESDGGRPNHYFVTETGDGRYVGLVRRNPHSKRDEPTKRLQITDVGAAERFLVGPGQ